MIVLFLLLACFVACAPQAEATDTFPLREGTIWVYSYESYGPSTSNADQIAKAAYQLVETVSDTEITPNTLVAHIKRSFSLKNAELGWSELEANSQDETWYVLDEGRVYESPAPLEIQFGELRLLYDFPLSLGKTWCPLRFDPMPPHKEITNCDDSGKRMVSSMGVYETSAGKFNDCYEITEYFKEGNVIQWFCNGTGIVYKKYDHVGTKFGFIQTLTSYTNGRP
jgi:hypothetical protein